MNKKIIIFLFPVLVLLGCSKEVVKNDYYDSLVISYSKTACYGMCPVYEMTIKGNGEAVFEGKENIDKIGKYTLQLSQEEIDSLYTAFQDADFLNLKDEYTEEVTDLPTTFVSIAYNDKSKRIVDYHGAPKQLKQLEAYIETFVKRSDWTAAK